MSVESCHVHGPTYASKFSATLTKLRRAQEFSASVYQQLPKQCCTCYGTTTCTSFDLDGLRKMCLSLISTTPKKKDSDEENEDLGPMLWKKNKKKQQMKFDRRSDLKQQLDDYEEGDDISDDSGDDGICQRPIIFERPPKPVDPRIAILEAKNEARRKKFNEFSASFKAIPVPENCCMVHDRKYRSQLNHVLNNVRLGLNYRGGVIRDFTKQCCSCNGNKMLSSINPQLFKDELDRIQSTPVVKSVKTFEWIVLPSGDLTESAKSAKTGHFIGKNGRNLRKWQDQYNIRINIINSSSKETIKERILTISPTGELNGLVLSFEKRDLTINDPLKTDEIKAEILKAWEAAKDTIESGRRMIRRRRILRRR